ncbi:MAG: sulfatase-like hydrolase/transferase [Rhizobiaceae bacterium]|nr:sulfatase-like hydrolase/transferase [Rhizobiaceae bacterium]
MTTNQLIIMSDEHTRKILGAYGNDVVQTPNLDRLAARGTLFEAAYCPCPICVPSRAAFATGQYVHATGHWDNAQPYTGTPHSWGHALQQIGVEVGSIGKLHYRNDQDDVGFDFQHLPMHVVGGHGDILGSVRDELPVRQKGLAMAEKVGRGDTSYSAYDRSIADCAVDWLATKKPGGAPWICFVSFVTPHFPLIAPDEFYDLYAAKNLSPQKTDPGDLQHPWIKQMRQCLNMVGWTEERTTTALTAYYGLVSFMDAQVGRVLDALEAQGLTSTTQVIYTSDHGDNVGEWGMWGKSTMNEESVGVPMIVAGPGIPEGKTSKTPVNLLDIPTALLKSAGAQVPVKMIGSSLYDLAQAEDDLNRVVFSEYHAMGAPTGAFMIRKGRWKLIHYVGHEPQLFDLQDDPEELNDLGTNADYVSVRSDLMQELHTICDPEAIDRQTKADQAATVAQHGGRASVVEKGGFGATPPPGQSPEYAS